MDSSGLSNVVGDQYQRQQNQVHSHSHSHSQQSRLPSDQSRLSSDHRNMSSPNSLFNTHTAHLHAHSVSHPQQQQYDSRSRNLSHPHQQNNSSATSNTLQLPVQHQHHGDQSSGLRDMRPSPAPHEQNVSNFNHMPLPFTGHFNQQSPLPPMRPLDVLPIYNPTQNDLSESSAPPYLGNYQQTTVHQQSPAFFNQTPPSAPQSTYDTRGPFDPPSAFGNMGNYGSDIIPDIGERIKTNRRATTNPYKESNGSAAAVNGAAAAAYMRRTRSTEGQIPPIVDSMPEPTPLPVPASAPAPAPAPMLGQKRPSEQHISTPDQRPAKKPRPSKSSSNLADSAVSANQPDQDDGQQANGGDKTPKSKKKSQPKDKDGSAIRSRAKVLEQSMENIKKYSTPEQDLDWTKVEDPQVRRSMQLIIANLVRNDKKKMLAQQQGNATGNGSPMAKKPAPKKPTKKKSNAHESNAIAGSNDDNNADADHDIDTQHYGGQNAGLYGSGLQNGNGSFQGMNDSHLLTQPFPTDLRPRNEGGNQTYSSARHSDQADRARVFHPTPELEDDEAVLQLKLERYDVLIALKQLEIRRQKQSGKKQNGPPASTSYVHSADICPKHDVEFDNEFVKAVKMDLKLRAVTKRALDFDVRSARRLLTLLDQGLPPNDQEALFLTGRDAAKWVEPGQFFQGVIVTEGQQTAPLQTPQEFLDEYPDDTAEIWIQDPSVRLNLEKPHARQVTVRQVKERLAHTPQHHHPWNCLELATHFDDGLRPAFLNNEDCRLLTKLKIPGEREKAARRGYEEGWKEVEKWALVAQAGALTEPHQDSHGYSTFITVNTGPIGFGWLSNPSPQERKEWHSNPHTYSGGRWRYVVLKAGQTVFFPSGTVHFVFRLRSCGHTLAYGGHILRCSQIVRWVQTLLEEQSQPQVTNEDLSQSAPGYLSRVEKFVKHARRMGQSDKWGGAAAFDEFLRLKQQFMQGK